MSDLTQAYLSGLAPTIRENEVEERRSRSTSRGSNNYKIAPPSTSQWVQIATDNERRVFRTNVDVAYGVSMDPGEPVLYKYNITGRMLFNPIAFGGDPAPGQKKKGWFRTAATPNPNWVPVASELQSMTFSSNVDVAFGVSVDIGEVRVYYLYNVIGQVTFDNQFFGSGTGASPGNYDPAPNTPKFGWWRDPGAQVPPTTAPAPVDWVQIAQNNEFVNFPDNVDVAYGYTSRFPGSADVLYKYNVKGVHWFNPFMFDDTSPPVSGGSLVGWYRMPSDPYVF